MKARIILIISFIIIPRMCWGTYYLGSEHIMERVYKNGNELFNRRNYNMASIYIEMYAKYKKRFIIDDLLKSTSEEKRAMIWNIYKDIYVYQIPFLAHYCKTDSLISEALNASIFSKGILLNASTTLKQIIIEKEPSLLKAYNELEKLNLEYHQTTTRENTRTNIEFDLLVTRRQHIDSLLHERFPRFFTAGSSLTVTWRDIQLTLKENDVIIDFIEIPIHNGDNLYMAFVVKANYNIPKMIPLFRKSELPISNNYPIVDEHTAYQKIWSPLNELLEGCENIYFSPAGILNMIAVEYLPDERGLPISWLYNMHRLSNLRELVVERESTPFDKVVLIGGLFYNKDEKTTYFNTNNGFRGAERRSYFSYLPSSLSEVQNIQEILNKKGINVELFTGNEMPEDSINHFQGKPFEILHFATHGFFLEGQAKDTTEYQELAALSRSGVALSGANDCLPEWTSNPKYVSTTTDNILTSLEISKMDLSKVNMVILSTCVSGLGQSGTDGLYGLQRAFKKAGVRTQLVSLWNIDDEATSIFITSFYRYYSQFKDAFRALKLAQQALCIAQNGRYNHPRYWATFILIDGVKSTNTKKRPIIAPVIPSFT